MSSLFSLNCFILKMPPGKTFASFPLLLSGVASEHKYLNDKTRFKRLSIQLCFKLDSI